MTFQRHNKLINDPAAAVNEFIDGLMVSHTDLRLLSGYPETKVVVRTDLSHERVAVISGGGSGHEPAHAGFVGKGMLTAAICGDIFVCPPVDAVLAGIRAVTGPRGCLLIVKNYTSNRLNFGLAAEEAKAEGYKVEMVIVGDDCALPPPRGVAGRRGLAGTILVQKVAGAAAEALLSLEEVAAEAKNASELVGTMGVGLSVSTLPGQFPSERLGPGKMELGLGIHGEPGAALADLKTLNVIISYVLEQILSKETKFVPITRGSRVVLMINGLGATTMMELMIAAGKAVPQLELEHGLAIDKVYTGSFMTSLDMAGFSVSIMRADPTIMKRLTAPTNAPYWPVDTKGLRIPAKLPIPVKPCRPQKIGRVSVRPEKLSRQGFMLEEIIKAAANCLLTMEENLNDWDREVGDGDCGTTMFIGATTILEDMKNYYPLNDATETINEIGCSTRKVMGGTSGIIYDIFFRSAYANLKENKTANPSITPKQWANTFEAAVAAVTKYGGAELGFRTLLDAFVPAVAVLQKKFNEGCDPLEAFLQSAEAAVDGAKDTIHMREQSGRPGYVSAKALGTVPDPGAMAAASWYSAAVWTAKVKWREVLLRRIV